MKLNADYENKTKKSSFSTRNLIFLFTILYIIHFWSRLHFYNVQMIEEFQYIHR